MIVPKYVQNIMQRASYTFDFDPVREDCGCGYTIRIRKATPYTRIATLVSECERLVNWVNRQVPETAYIIQKPELTHYCVQSVMLTIFDPVMLRIEKYMK